MPLEKYSGLKCRNPRYVKDFGVGDLIKMEKGLAPAADPAQWLGGRPSYEIHHMTPLHDGGAVYDMSDLLITTPKYHKEVLESGYHYKRIKK